MTALLRAEWVRLTSLRSPWWSLSGAVAIVVVSAWVLASSALDNINSGDLPASTIVAPVDAVVPALQFGLSAIAAFALLPVTGEMANGSIRCSLLATPVRWRLLAARGLVVSVSAAAMAVPLVYGASVLVVAVLGDRGSAFDPLDAAWRASLVVGIAAWLTTGLAAVLRSTAGTLAASFVLLVGMLAAPGLVGEFSPAQTLDAFARASDHDVQGLMVFAAWAVGIWCLGAVVVERRDTP